MLPEVGRHTWLNTIVGSLDAAFILSEEEMFFTSLYIRDLLDLLNIPGRTEPRAFPAPIVTEAASGLYAHSLSEIRSVGLVRKPLVAGPMDVRVSLEAWRQAFMGLLLVSYPDLAPNEQLTATKVFDDILLALGVPDRLATHFPDTVVRAHLTGA